MAVPNTFDKVRQYLLLRGGAALANRMIQFDQSSATVELAAACLGCDPSRIAKTLAFEVKLPAPSSPKGTSKGGPLPAPRAIALIVAAGDAKVDKDRFKRRFACQPNMVKKEVVFERVGHYVGGVCPFAVGANWAPPPESGQPAPTEAPPPPETPPLPISVYLDVSLQRFEVVYPACGSANSGIGLRLPELEELSDYVEWVDVCDGWARPE